jgi:hypothetical protein
MIRLMEARLVPSKAQWGLWESAHFTIGVENLSFEKQVLVHFASGQEVAAHYVKPLEGNLEQWECELPINTRYPELKFALRYLVAGQEYWDNNQEQDYLLDYAHNTLSGQAA